MQTAEAITEAHLRAGARARSLEEVRVRPSTSAPGAVVRACRPRQWMKNAVVVAAPAAAGALSRSGTVRDVCGAFVAFCLLSSAAHLFNDVRDREQDGLYLRNRFRPTAAGQLSPTRALWLAGALALAGIGVSGLVRPELAAIALGYVALNVSHSLWLRRIAVADMAAVAGGYLLRALGGDVAARVTPSASFLVLVSACALFLVAGRRHGELVEHYARETRFALHRYSPRVLRWVLVSSAALACLAYARWAFDSPQLVSWLDLSLLPFMVWLLRYGTLLAGGARKPPEDVLLSDPLLVALALLWAALFTAGVYGPT
ncbi:MAG: decaprenyl-phosphate phosphoribosyltransferase [Solirubrobacterales bacterium]|nr:decaprenyl-phosphate phosphoribosyltransferase [Solirubrobacterales bacterium]